MTFFLILYLLVGLLFSGLAIPLILRRIKPNAWYGFRVEQTLHDPEVWYEANAYAGKYMLGVGLVTSGVAIGLYLAPGLDETVYLWVCTLTLLGGLGVSVIQSFRFLRRFTQK